MDTRTEHYLQSTSEILRNFLLTSQLNRKQADNLQVAARLVDCLLIEASIAKDAADSYVSSVRNLLPDLEQAVVDVSDIISSLKDYGGDFTAFLADVAGLQRALSGMDDQAAVRLARSLQKYDADYADAVYSRGIALANNERAENRSGAVNVRHFDEAALLEFIRAQLPGNSKAKIESSGFVSGGHSKFTLAIELTGTNTIPPEIILRGDASDQFSGADVAYEHRLQKALYEHSICVPRPLALEESGSVFGSPFMLSERASGSTIGHMFDMPEPDEKVLIDIARHLAAIHEISIEDLGDWVSNANNKTSDKVLEWLELGYRDLSATGLHSATFEAAFSWLRENAILNDAAPRTLVHGDFGLNNLLIEGSDVQAILDWEFAHVGNPAYDLGYFYYMARALGSWDQFLESYASSGGALPDEEQLNYSILLASTRLGVQCAQAHSAFDAGLAGIGAARVISNQYVNESILRMSETLDRIFERVGR